MIENKGKLEKYSKLKNIKRTLTNYLRNFSDSIDDTIKSVSDKSSYKTKEEIKEYRKKIKIYDTFIFNNELEILDIRLNILNDYVDYFVLVESPLTHSGKPKELMYEKNKHLFKKFEHKIIHYVVEEPIKDFEDFEKRLNDPIIPAFEHTILEDILSFEFKPEKISFIRNSYECDSIKKVLANIHPSDDDFCFISDLDEIWNPNALIDYSKDDIFKVKQLSYVYYLNNRSNENWRGWTGTIGTKYKNIKNNSTNRLRTLKIQKYTIVKNGGWHFTSQGGAQLVRQKVESTSHTEIDNTKIKSRIEDNLLKNKDIMGRYYKFWIDEKDLPKYLLENKEKYKNLFK